jgi:hypothetical protein
MTWLPWQIYQKVSEDSCKSYQQPINKGKHYLNFQVLDMDFEK